MMPVPASVLSTGPWRVVRSGHWTPEPEPEPVSAWQAGDGETECGGPVMSRYVTSFVRIFVTIVTITVILDPYFILSR